MKRNILILLIVILFSQTTYAQKQGQELIDSLRQVLPETKDSREKVKLLDDLSFEYYLINPDKGIEYARQGLKIAKKLNWVEAEASFYNSLATNYLAQSNYSKALEYYYKALTINEELDYKSGIADNLVNIGIIYHDQSEFDKALEYYYKALLIDEEIDNKHGIASDLLSIGSIYSDRNEYEKALEFYERALEIVIKLDNKRSIAFNLGNIGIVYYKLKDYVKAFEYYYDAKEYFSELGDISSEARAYAKIGKLYFEIAKDSLNEFIQNPYYSNNKQENINKAIENLIISIEMFTEVGEIDALKDYYYSLSEAYRFVDDYEKALESYISYVEAKDTVYNIESQKRITRLENKRELELRDKQIEIQDLKINNQRTIQIALALGILIMLVFIFFVIKERRKSEQLLLNVLPATIAKRLKKNKGRHIADRFDHAAIVFCDIAGFTKMSSSISAEKLVDMLNDIFIRFDQITEKYDMEKIKTIGDCYMTVAGIPEVQDNAAKIAVQWAIDARESMRRYRIEEGLDISLRFGIDCGPVVAGVIGEKKFIYDLWGDTVNTASRMESNGILNEIHVTENIKNALQNDADFEFVERGGIEIKGKGLMHTFLLGNK